MEHIPNLYNCRNFVGSSAIESDKEFHASCFDELLNDEDCRLLECDLHNSWWAYSEINMRPPAQA